MYKGGAFQFSFVINTNYPHEPPKVKCIPKVRFTLHTSGAFLFLIFTQIYHPNVDLEGNVCLNILREDWKPVLNLNSVMVGLQYLFLEPNADDPLNKGLACNCYGLGFVFIYGSFRGGRRPTEASRDISI